MSLEEKSRLILSLDVLIRSKIPGKADYLAKRLGISRSTFFRLIEYMREELYAPVYFDSVMNRYSYEEEGIILFRFVPSSLLNGTRVKNVDNVKRLG